MDRILKTLIVDDSLAICQLLREHLLHYGVTMVDYCHDGQQALSMIERNNSVSYDAIFVDLHMAGMDGLALMQQLNELRFRGAVIIISALDSRIVSYTMEVVSSYNLRLLGCIEKPIERSLVAFMVRRIRSANGPKIDSEKLPRRREVIQALNNNQLQVYFQPIIDGNTNQIYSLECLTRLDINKHNHLGPDLFLPVIEKFGLFDIFMEKMIFGAAEGLKLIRLKTDIETKIAINLSPSQLLDDNLPETLSTLIENNGLGKSSVSFEITENYNLSEAQQQKNLSRLRIHGFELSLDDYGSGYTNLHQITNMPFNEIKLDAELINGMHKDKVLKIIIESITKITQELNLKVIAEGISNPHDLIMLDELGIHLYQGYFFAKPKPANEFIRWYQQWQNAMAKSIEMDKKVFERGE